MKWTRKTEEFEYADFISGDYHIRDMSIHDRGRWLEHWKKNGGKKTEWWALLKDEQIIAWSHTVKALKELAETL